MTVCMYRDIHTLQPYIIVIGRFQWQGAAEDVMTHLATCELCLFL